MGATNASRTATEGTRLTAGIDRFLSRTLAHAMAREFHTATGFLSRFPPEVLMPALAGNDALRARVLVEAAGVHERIAAKKSIESAVEDLKLALAEGVTTPEKILELVTADDQVSHLPSRDLWDFATSDAFVDATPGGDEHDRAAARMTFLVEAAIEEDLLTLRDVFDGLGFEEIARYLPEGRVRELLVYSLGEAREGRELTEDRFVDVVSLGELLTLVPLPHTWRQVVLDRVAGPRDLTDGGTKTTSVEPGTPRATKATRKSTNRRRAAESSETGAGETAEATEEDFIDAGEDIEIDVDAADVPTENPTTPSVAVIEDETRARVSDRLLLVGRLPPDHEALPIPILLSIESMYAEFYDCTSDDEREACIRESFPNDSHLKQAMLALIQVLDPSIDITESQIRDAAPTALMKVVMFEERQQARPSRVPPPARASQRPPPRTGPRSSVPPPLPPPPGTPSSAESRPDKS